MIKLALLRHGHTAWNRAGQLQGRSDVHLDGQARESLSAVQLPTQWRNADLVSSPLARAYETAKLLSGRAPRIEPRLIEMNWGDWEGKRGLDLAADPKSGFKHVEDWGWDYCPPNGESPRSVRDRLLPWVFELDRDTVAVCHIGTMRVLMATATRWQFNGPAPFQIKRNRLYVLNIDQNSLQLDATQDRLEPR